MLMDIPPGIRVKGGLRTGTVYFFKEESHASEAPAHFFVVLNTNPISDKVLILVCASSKIDRVKWRRRNLSTATLVEIMPSEYAGFTLPTIFDCNEVYEKTIEQLVRKLESGSLGANNFEMNPELVEKLRVATKASPLVRRELKDLL